MNLKEWWKNKSHWLRGAIYGIILGIIYSIISSLFLNSCPNQIQPDRPPTGGGIMCDTFNTFFTIIFLLFSTIIAFILHLIGINIGIIPMLTYLVITILFILISISIVYSKSKK